MPNIAATQLAGATFGNTGKFFIGQPTLSATAERSLPPGVNAVAQRPCFISNNDGGYSRMYAVGGWTDNLVLTENFTLARQGIAAPIYSIINSAGSGLSVGLVANGTGITGTCIGHIAWWDDVNKRRSSLSAGSPTITLTNQGRKWDNLPIDGGGDPTVTHIELWVSMNGNSPRLVSRHDLGTTTVTESTATLSLGIDFGDSFTRFPRCSFNVMYHDRQAMAGDPEFPDRIYLSQLNEPEHYGGLYLRTRRGEAVVGLAVVRDILVVFCATSSYIIQGYTEDDLECVILEPMIGSIGHFSIQNAHGLAIVPAQIGWYLCTGNSMHPISKDFQWTWRREFASNIPAFEDSWAVFDQETNTYKLYLGTLVTSVNNPQSLVPGGVPPAGVVPNVYWTIDCTDMLQETGGTYEPPRMNIDCRAREDSAAAMMALPGEKTGHLYTASCDGIVRQENINDGTAGGADDDGDLFGKTWFLLTGTYFFGAAGGGPTDAATFTKFWNFMECEQSAYDLWLWAGDERQSTSVWSLPSPAVTHVDPSFKMAVAAGQQVGTDPLTNLGTISVPKAVEFCSPHIAGRGLAMAVRALSPVYDDQSGRMPSWKGFGGVRVDEGTTHRGLATTGLE